MKNILSAIFFSGAIIPLIFSLIFFLGYFLKWNFLLEYVWFAPDPLMTAVILLFIGIVWMFRCLKKSKNNK